MSPPLESERKSNGDQSDSQVKLGSAGTADGALFDRMVGDKSFDLLSTARQSDSLSPARQSNSLTLVRQAESIELLNDLAPENKVARYGMVTALGVAELPSGVWKSVVHNATNPWEAAKTFGMGAGMAVVLKTVLPEGGVAGKLAGAAIGVYFTYQAAEPIIDGYKKAGNAHTMAELKAASVQIGDARGMFLVDSAIAASGYKIGSHYTGRVLSSQMMDGFADRKANFYDRLGNAATNFKDKVGTSFSALKTDRVLPSESSSQAPGSNAGSGLSQGQALDGSSNSAKSLDGKLKLIAAELKTTPGVLQPELSAILQTEKIDVSVMLRSKGSDLRMERTLARIAQGRQSPLTDAQFSEHFSASEKALSALTKFSQENRLTVKTADLSSGRVVLNGSAAQFSEAFNTKLSVYKHASGLLFQAHEGSVSVPKALGEHITGIYGLDNSPRAGSRAVFEAGPKKSLSSVPLEPGDNASASSGAKSRQAAGAPRGVQAEPRKVDGAFEARKVDGAFEARKVDGAVEPRQSRGFMPNEVADAYNFPKESMGNGQSVAILELGGKFDQVDNAKYYKNNGLPEPKINVIELDGSKGRPMGGVFDTEVALDSQVIGAVAPAAQQNIIFAPNSEKGFVDAIARATFPQGSEAKNSVISISWGMNESSWSKEGIAGMHDALKKAALKGISIFASAGDDGALDRSTNGKWQAHYPASDPQATGTGGTRLSVDNNGKIKSEVVWNNNRAGDAGGGGVSEVFGPQEFQKNVKVPPNANSGKAGRGVPDVTGNADPVTGYRIRVDGSEGLIGGTSAVAPLYSALMLRINGTLGKPFGTPLNPWLYQNAHRGFFNDVLLGDNNAYKAAPGWDAASGFGSIDGSKMLAAIKDSPHVSVKFGNFRYVGPADLSKYTIPTDR